MSTSEIITKLTTAAESDDITERISAARHPLTPIRSLRQLYLDGDRRLKDIVRRNPKWELFRDNLKSGNPDLMWKPERAVDDLLARL